MEYDDLARHVWKSQSILQSEKLQPELKFRCLKPQLEDGRKKGLILGFSYIYGDSKDKLVRWRMVMTEGG